MPLDDRQSEAHLGSRSWAVGIPIANEIVLSRPANSIESGRRQRSGHSMQHVMRKLYSDGRTSACDCSIWINPMPRADPKRPYSGFDNFVETLTGFVAAETGDEDQTHEAWFVATLPFMSACAATFTFRCQPYRRLNMAKGAESDPWFGPLYATNRRRTNLHFLNWLATGLASICGR